MVCREFKSICASLQQRLTVRCVEAASVLAVATRKLTGPACVCCCCWWVFGAGGMAGRGTLLRGPLAAQGASGPAEGTPKGYSVPADINSKAAAHTTSPFAATTLPGHRNDKEPTVEEATIKASVLFRPGSPISIGRAGSSRLAAAASHAGASGKGGEGEGTQMCCASGRATQEDVVCVAQACRVFFAMLSRADQN